MHKIRAGRRAVSQSDRVVLLADAAQILVVLRLHELLAHLAALVHELLKGKRQQLARYKLLASSDMLLGTGTQGIGARARPRCALRAPGTGRARGGSFPGRARRRRPQSARCGTAWCAAWAPRRRSTPAPRPPARPRPPGTGARRSCPASTTSRLPTLSTWPLGVNSFVSHTDDEDDDDENAESARAIKTRGDTGSETLRWRRGRGWPAGYL